MKKLFMFTSLFCLALMARAEDFTLTVADVTIDEGDKVVSFDIETSSAEAVGLYSAYQFDLVLPECLTFPYDAKAEDYGIRDTNNKFVGCFSSEINRSQHTINVKQQLDGSWRFVTYSGTNQKFWDDAGNVLLTITAAVKEGTKPGVYPISIKESSALFAASKSAVEGGTDAAHPSLVAGTLSIATTINYVLATDYGTLILPFEATLPEGLKVYSCESVDNKVLTLTEQDELEANTPYIVGGTAQTYEFKGVPTNTANSYTDGLLTGVLVDTEVAAGNYVLQQQTDGLGFYRVGSIIPTVSAYHCYLTYSDADEAPLFRIGGSTRIEGMQVSPIQSTYDMLGRKVAEPAQKGIYIVNGKKVLVK